MRVEEQPQISNIRAQASMSFNLVLRNEAKSYKHYKIENKR